MINADDTLAVYALYHRKSPRHNWLCYAYSFEAAHVARLEASCKRDTLYWESNTAQMATLQATVGTMNANDNYDNCKRLPDTAHVVNVQ